MHPAFSVIIFTSLSGAGYGSLAILGALKYFDFFVQEFCTAASWFGFSPSPEGFMLNLVLPVGISFYTFQTMAYSIDLYRGDIKKPEMSLPRFALYVSFFLILLFSCSFVSVSIPVAIAAATITTTAYTTTTTATTTTTTAA